MPNIEKCEHKSLDRLVQYVFTSSVLQNSIFTKLDSNFEKDLVKKIKNFY